MTFDPDGRRETIRRMSGSLKPHRLILGECSEAEASELLEPMENGIRVMTTIRASSPQKALALFGSTWGHEQPDSELWREKAAAIDSIIHTELLADGRRKVISITEVTGCKGEKFATQDLFKYEILPDSKGNAYGRFVATGVNSVFSKRMEEAGIRLPSNIFQERVLMKD